MIEKVVWLNEATAKALKKAGHDLRPLPKSRRSGGTWKENCAAGFGELNALIDAIGAQGKRLQNRIAELEAENAELRARLE